jgi:hypothetical protein
VIDKLAHHLIHTFGRGRMFLGSAAVNILTRRPDREDPEVN